MLGVVILIGGYADPSLSGGGRFFDSTFGSALAALMVANAVVVGVVGGGCSMVSFAFGGGLAGCCHGCGGTGGGNCLVSGGGASFGCAWVSDVCCGADVGDCFGVGGGESIGRGRWFGFEGSDPGSCGVLLR